MTVKVSAPAGAAENETVRSQLAALRHQGDSVELPTEIPAARRLAPTHRDL